MSFSLLTQLLQLNRRQWTSRDELEKVQLSKLQRQLYRAWDQTAFYRERYAYAGFNPADLKSLSDLRKVPIVTKTELVEVGEVAACSDIDESDCVRLKTSGSTGMPLSLPFTRQDKAHRVLKELRALSANGYRPRDRMLILIDPEDIVKGQALIQRLGFLRREYISIFADQSEQIDRILETRPDVIYSYTSCLRILAERIIEESRPAPRPKILMSAAEVLDQATRDLLKRAFGVDPIDFYGSMEFGWIGWQCSARNGYHINSDCLIVECLRGGRPAEPGEEGELFITNLHSDAFPLIRYAIGDAGVPSAKMCSCGRVLPLLEHVSGRTADCIHLSDGRKLSPYSLTCAVRDVQGVRRFQVIQETMDRIMVRVIPKDGPVDPEQITSVIQKAVGNPVSVSVEQVDTLPLESNGKFKIVKSLAGAMMESEPRGLAG